MTTRDDILALLRRHQLTVTEIVETLGVTRNAVIQPLRQLEAAGYVQGVEARKGKVGKPAVVYQAAPGHEDIHSGAYPPFVELMLEALGEDLPRKRIARLMSAIGHKMATHLEMPAEVRFPERLAAARGFVDKLGAETIQTREDGLTMVRSYSCPLARAVRREPCVCKAMAQFFSSATGAVVEERCIRSDGLICQFAISDPA